MKKTFPATKFQQSFRIKSCSFLIGAEHTLRSPYLPRECLRVRLIRLGRDQPLLREFVKVVTWIFQICYMDFSYFLHAHRTLYHALCALDPQVRVRLIRLKPFVGMDQTSEPLHLLETFQPFFNASRSLTHQFTKRLSKHKVQTKAVLSMGCASQYVSGRHPGQCTRCIVFTISFTSML